MTCSILIVQPVVYYSKVLVTTNDHFLDPIPKAQDMGNITRSGRCYAPKEVEKQRKGKVKKVTALVSKTMIVLRSISL